MFSLGRRRQDVNVWPGFVDALASVLLVFVFLLLIFVLGQFFLTDVLMGRDKALDQLSTDIHSLSEVLALERKQRQSSEQQLSDTERKLSDIESKLEATLLQREILQKRSEISEQMVARQRQDLQSLDQQLNENRQQLSSRAEALQVASDRERQLRLDLKGVQQQLEQRSSDLQAATEREAGLTLNLDSTRQQLQQSQTSLQQEQNLSRQAQDQLALFTEQLSALRQQLAAVSAELVLSQKEVKDQQVKIDDLGNKLNVALVDKVRELKKYRSEFFGRLRAVLGEEPGLRIEGDRFVFQSELLFESGSAELGKPGRKQLLRLANSLVEVAEKIPQDVDWILRVDGHTDRRPISTPEFASNWELSTARATSIVKYLIEQGIEPSRLAAAGFAEFHPLDDRRTAEAYQRNRRIEIKLTQP